MLPQLVQSIYGSHAIVAALRRRRRHPLPPGRCHTLVSHPASSTQASCNRRHNPGLASPRRRCLRRRTAAAATGRGSHPRRRNCRSRRHLSEHNARNQGCPPRPHPTPLHAATPPRPPAAADAAAASSADPATSLLMWPPRHTVPQPSQPPPPPQAVVSSPRAQVRLRKPLPALVPTSSTPPP